MGYRVRLGKLAKTDAFTLRSMSATECAAYFEDRPDAPYRPQNHTELYEIGKYFSLDDKQKYCTPVYAFDLEEEEFFILSKEGLIALILQYQSTVAEYYAGLKEKAKLILVDQHIVPKPEDESDKKAMMAYQENQYLLGQLFADISSKCSEWNSPYLTPVQFESGKDGEMTGSWKMEYAIFNLLYILKTFDFDNNYLIYSGW